MSRSRAARMPLLVLLLVLALPSVAGAAKRPDQAKRAKALAGQLERARTFDARRKALLRTFRALGVGVYTGNGRALVRGAERRTGVFAYDLEVRGLAHQLGTRRPADPATLLRQLRGIGIARRDGAALTQADVIDRIPAAVRRARANRRARSSLATLLIAELGRRGKRPLAGPGARYDALQVWLMGAELLAGAKAAAGVASAGPVATAAQDPKPCFRGQRRAGKLIDGIGAFGDVLDDAIKAVSNLGAGPLHSLGLAAFIVVEPTSTGQVTSTHYGTAHPASEGGRPGRALVFQVGVQMVVEPPERLIRCGPLAGLRVPKKGPIPDIPINWDGLMAEGLQVLQQHGTITRKDEKTGANGVAVLTFQPHDEPLPGLGEERLVVSVLDAEAEVFSGLGAKFGHFNEIVSGHTAPIAFSIGAHVARGYFFRSETDEICFFTDFCGDEAERARFTYTARMCGWNPYGTPWTGAMETTSNQSDPDSEPLDFVLTKDQFSTWFQAPPVGNIDNRADFLLLPGPPARMRVDAFHSNNLAPGSENYRRYEDHKTVEIVDILSCPEVPRLPGQVRP